MMKGIGVPLVIFFIVLFFYPAITTAAPPPSEEEERKEVAPLHLIGTVSSDEIYQDITKDEDYPQQIRKMILKVNQMIKAPALEKEKVDFEVYYTYIPSWQAHMYFGGKRMDIAESDKIEIWLNKGEHGWEPALGGNTVQHIKYAEIRNEPILEPIIHAINRKTSAALKEYTEITVLFVLIFIMVLIGITALKKS